MDIILNLCIFAITLILTLRIFYKNGKWALRNGARAFRYFTVLSNVFCAVAALLMCMAGDQPLVWTLKYIGTAAVTVTFLTVFLFLGPTMGYRQMLQGSDFFMHLVTPLLAVFSFCVPERRGMSFGVSLLGMLPLVFYGIVYLHRVVFMPEGRGWEDFYGFNRGGKWAVSLAAMLAGNLIVCIAFYFVQQIP